MQRHLGKQCRTQARCTQFNDASNPLPKRSMQQMASTALELPKQTKDPNDIRQQQRSMQSS